jgi:hypothetical protein
MTTGQRCQETQNGVQCILEAGHTVPHRTGWDTPVTPVVPFATPAPAAQAERTSPLLKAAVLIAGGLAVAVVAFAIFGGSGRPSVGAAPVTPSPVPAVVATPVPTPEPVLPPAVQTGVITFGKDYDPDTLLIVGPASKFKATRSSIAWSAALSEPAGATSLTIIIASRSASGIERILVKEDTDLSMTDADLIANKLDLASLVDNKVGTYVMRYVREATVLAEGMFTLTK